jgi:hypothetical protein
VRKTVHMLHTHHRVKQTSVLQICNTVRTDCHHHLHCSFIGRSLDLCCSHVDVPLSFLHRFFPRKIISLLHLGMLSSRIKLKSKTHNQIYLAQHKVPHLADLAYSVKGCRLHHCAVPYLYHGVTFVSRGSLLYVIFILVWLFRLSRNGPFGVFIPANPLSIPARLESDQDVISTKRWNGNIFNYVLHLSSRHSFSSVEHIMRDVDRGWLRLGPSLSKYTYGPGEAAFASGHHVGAVRKGDHWGAYCVVPIHTSGCVRSYLPSLW